MINSLLRFGRDLLGLVRVLKVLLMWELWRTVWKRVKNEVKSERGGTGKVSRDLGL